MKLTFTDSAWEDYLWFQETQPHLLKRLNDLIKDAKRSGFQGIGKPEPIKGDLSGCWSRYSDFGLFIFDSIRRSGTSHISATKT